MPRSRRGTRPEKSVTPLNIDEIWASGQVNDHTFKPPQPNLLSLVPHTRLVHDLNDLSNIFNAVVIDNGVVELIQKKTPVFDEKQLTRQLVTLHLVGYESVLFDLSIWVVPVYSDGVMAHLIYAADFENLELLRTHRNFVKPKSYNIHD